MIAALFVEPAPRGVYQGLPNVDPWDEKRDARLYAGPWPVVAHPPCERWGDCFHGCVPIGHPRRGRLGDDGGCFSAALKAVETFGGVLEHPEHSKAWRAFGLAEPYAEGWWSAGIGRGWTARIEQGHFGHRANKPTWLLVSARARHLPSLPWGPSGKGSLMAKVGHEAKYRSRTPIPFRDLLIGIAESCHATR